MNLSSMKYIEMRKHQNNDFKRCQDFEDMGKIRCLCQNGSRHKNRYFLLLDQSLLFVSDKTMSILQKSRKYPLNIEKSHEN